MDTLRFLRLPAHALSIFLVLGCCLSLSTANSVQANTDHGNFKIMEYDKQLVLQCNITASPPGQFTLRWFKDGKVLESSSELKIDSTENKITFTKASEATIGNYTCQAVNTKTNNTESVMKAEIQVIGLPKITLADDTPVVEGERLKLHCSVRAYPPPLVNWSFGENSEAVNVNNSHLKLEEDPVTKIAHAYLVIDNVQMSDRNTYMCHAQNQATFILTSKVEKHTFVRVKDKLAALWPFLGICAEVAVLCTIILIYEKKRNKAELDESDTDQSPEQKNTPDHGKDVRQRK